MTRLLLPFAAIGLLSGCDLVPQATDADAGADAQVLRGQGSEVSGALAINEVVAKAASGPDWLEIYNGSAQSIDLCNFFVTDSLGRLDHYLHLGSAPPPEACDPKLLQPGEYLVIIADDHEERGWDHAPFKLGLADEAHLVATSGKVVDSLVFLNSPHNAGLSLARQPDGEGLFWPSDPTQGIANR